MRLRIPRVCWTRFHLSITVISPSSECSLRSKPAQKDFPSPRSSTARTASLEPARSKASSSSAYVDRLRALWIRGRFSTISTTPGQSGLDIHLM